jgi:hypothetical protein
MQACECGPAGCSSLEILGALLLVPSRLAWVTGSLFGLLIGPFPAEAGRSGHLPETPFAPHVLRFKLADSELESGWDLWPRPRGRRGPASLTPTPT